MNNFCTICKQDLQIPHSLPCTHVFCFLCIRRHIEKRNFCPLCFKAPFSSTDLKTNSKQYNKIDKIPILVCNKEDRIKKELKKRKCFVTGNKNQLAERYLELFINTQNECYRETPRNMDGIARHINKQEIENKQIRIQNEKDMSKVKSMINKIKLEFLDKRKIA